MISVETAQKALEALNALPEKKLSRGAFVGKDGSYCITAAMVRHNTGKAIRNLQFGTTVLPPSKPKGPFPTQPVDETTGKKGSLGDALIVLGPERSDLIYMNDYGVDGDRFTANETAEGTFERVLRILTGIVTSGQPQAVRVF